MTLEKALRLAELMEPGHVVDEELLIEFLNELEGLIQVEIMLLAPEEVTVYTVARDTPTPGLEKAPAKTLDAIADRVRELGIPCTVGY